ncbi:MAG: folylpolyglutamate synthase/dihydrofolate synthase family protein [Aureisphaera sp.]
MYQRVGKAAYKADLSNTWKLADYLGNPEKGLKCIHVGGTNGKGSTSHMLASVLQAAGYRVGLYTSPHLKDFRERIKINGVMIPKRYVSSFVSRHRPFFEANQLSFFEMTVGLAFDYFKNKEVDIAVIEVGLGGRLDSTNIVSPEVAVITNIGLDHTQFLGDTLPKIAKEKAGIIKTGVPTVIGENHQETRPVFEVTAKEMHAPLYFVDAAKKEVFPCDLLGDYQIGNQRTTLVAIDHLREKGWEIPEHQVKEGLLNVVNNTGLLGRWQVLHHEPKVVCDTAHNKEGLTIALAQLEREPHEQLRIVLGVVSDKDLKSILPLFPTSAQYYFCRPKIARALDAHILQSEANAFGLKGQVYATVKEAYRSALKAAQKEDVIYVGGSTFVVAEVL